MCSLVPPVLLIGRDVLYERMVHQLLSPQPQARLPIVICGMGGVGKSAFAASVMNDSRIQQHFEASIFCASLGKHPDILDFLKCWAAQCGIEVKEPTEARTLFLRLNAYFAKRSVLFIIDDIWEVDHASFFLLGGYDCCFIITTRLPSIANHLAARQADIIPLSLLNAPESHTLLQALTQQPYFGEIEGLPLLIQTLAILLNQPHSLVSDQEKLSLFHQILSAKPPLNYALPANETINNVADLLRRSFQDVPTQKLTYLKQLSQTVHATTVFHLNTLQALWHQEDAKSLVREFVNYGILEPLGQEKFYFSLLMKAFIDLHL
ncbi:hypothetical protein G4Y79_04655 [Phototrophicus methaneseepsis]|uniref:NB-ARC domain-containing protein n=1 Tax=Phototrophicus methaneseepsis TaxID=2710758 RepID=A0A7S8EB11_9CHLR|nr:NB-ARC domain-containing protein [Phototrophicus methaneseepsis]QPC83677.1 hypothetical protein G4Y79_04655 [Phototrophicus methaneseepsis]